MAESLLPELVMNPLTAFGLILATGVLGGQVAARVARLPSVVGYVLTGIVFGPYALGLLTEPVLAEAELFINFALGLALFEVGRRTDLAWLRRERWTLATAVAAALLCFVLLAAFLLMAGVGTSSALILASVGVASAPMVVLMIIHESRAEGQVSERLLSATGLSNLIAFLLFALVLSWSRFDTNASVERALLLPAWQLLGSVGLGLAAGLATIRLSHWMGSRQREARQVLLFGTIALVVGLAMMAGLLPAMALLVLGLATRNLDRHYAITERDLLSHAPFFFVAFFVAAGAQLDLSALRQHWPLALGFIAVRFAANAVPWLLAVRASGMEARRGALVALGLSPLSTGAVTLLALSSDIAPERDIALSGVLLSALCILELAGPVLTRAALRLAGETPDEQGER